MVQTLRKLAQEHSLSQRELKVFEYVVAHPNDSIELGARGVAAACETSAATVVRTAQKLEYRGFTDMCYRIQDIGALGSKKDVELTSSLHQAIDYPQCDQAAIAATARRLKHTRGMVYTYGHGFSSLMAAYFTKKLARLEIRSTAATADNSLCDFENTAGPGDTIALFSRGGHTERVVDHARIARDAGVSVITFTNDSANPLRDLADISLVIPDDHPLDNRSNYPTTFFAGVALMIEMIAAAYLALDETDSRR